jgi:hypothetical protein
MRTHYVLFSALILLNTSTATYTGIGNLLYSAARPLFVTKYNDLKQQLHQCEPSAEYVLPRLRNKLREVDTIECKAKRGFSYEVVKRAPLALASWWATLFTLTSLNPTLADNFPCIIGSLALPVYVGIIVPAQHQAKTLKLASKIGDHLSNLIYLKERSEGGTDSPYLGTDMEPEE